MIGNMIAKVRKEKKITKTKLAEMTDINIGHLTHIEKGERNPSHKALKTICSALDIPYQQLMYTYDKELTKNQEEYDLVNYISYNKIPLVSNIQDFIECPSSVPGACLAFNMPDNTMEPSIAKGTLLYLELNSLLENKELGLFNYNGELIVRRLLYKRNKLVLKADNKDIKDITLSYKDKVNLIGKVLI